MLIVVSNPVAVNNEAAVINSLFEAGLSLFHLRKPGHSIDNLKRLLDTIDDAHYPKIALHQHHEIAAQYGIQRFHFTEEKRKDTMILTKQEGMFLSTSVHSEDDYQNLSGVFDYCLIGPVYNSISKAGYNSIFKNDFGFLNKKRHIKLVAIGGIDSSNVQSIYRKGFDGAALLGTIWQMPENAVSAFKNINKSCSNTDQ